MSFLKGSAAAEDTSLSGAGIGEAVNFLNEKNHIFINKLNYICKNYDQSFKDVDRVKRILEESVLHQMEKQRLMVNESTDKVDFLQSKLLTIEKHLPVMIQEILEYYFDKKISEHLSNMVTKDEFKERLSVKLYIFQFSD